MLESAISSPKANGMFGLKTSNGIGGFRESPSNYRSSIGIKEVQENQESGYSFFKPRSIVIQKDIEQILDTSPALKINDF